MFKKSRNALLALGVLATLAGPFAAAASGASGQVCYFGECRETAAPAAPARSAPSPEARMVAKQGEWTALAIGSASMIVADFQDGSKFAVVIGASEKPVVFLSAPNWRLKAGQKAAIKMQIDGETYEGTAVATELGNLQISVDEDFLQALYRGRSAKIEVFRESFTLVNLADAAAVMDGMIHYRQTAAR